MRSRRCGRNGDGDESVKGLRGFQAQEAERSGTLVIEAKNVSFGYGDRLVIEGCQRRSFEATRWA